MPTESEPQKIGSLGHSIAELQIKRSEFWIARNLTEDYGIDIELEYSHNEVKGRFVKAQIKSHQQVLTKTDFISESFSKSFLRYVYECRIPIILIIVSVKNSKSWYVWLQKWLIDSNNVSNIYDESRTESLTVKVPVKNDFVLALNDEIISIASWENTTQLYITIRDLANLSLKLYDDRLSQFLFDYLEELNPKNETDENYLDSLIEKVIELGTSIWATNEGNKISQLLFKFIRERGEKLNANHISKLIIRGEDCSRTGLNALGLLYDNYPRHVASLNLIKRFEKFEDPRLHYYCTIRERYLNSPSPIWLLGNNDLTVGKLKADFSSISTSILDKWANRGDSVIFDYISIAE